MVKKLIAAAAVAVLPVLGAVAPADAAPSKIGGNGGFATVQGIDWR